LPVESADGGAEGGVDDPTGEAVGDGVMGSGVAGPEDGVGIAAAV
jgi:hypothetical protein